MEPVGASAAALQLIVFVRSIIDLIQTIRAESRDLPSRIRQRQEQLTSLADVLAQIERLPALEAEQQLRASLQSVQRKLQDLHCSLQAFGRQSQAHFVTRLWRSRSWARIEGDTLRKLGALEADKNTLILSTLLQLHHQVMPSRTNSGISEGVSEGMGGSTLSQAQRTNSDCLGR